MSEPAAGERVLFEARVSPRYALAGFWLALALGVVAFYTIAGSFHLLFVAAGPLLLAIREWNRVALRVTESTIQHQQPGWMAGALTLVRARAGLRIQARDVEGAEWIGHDNIGIRLKNGSVESVCFTHRIATARQASARAAIVQFIERATGSAPPPAPEFAPWVARTS